VARNISSLAGYGIDYEGDVIASRSDDEISPLRPLKKVKAGEMNEDKKVATKEESSPEQGKENKVTPLPKQCKLCNHTPCIMDNHYDYIL
jgi:hypothetical protein